MDSIKNRNNLLLFSALSVLALLRIGMVAGFLMDIPHIEHSGWQFHCGGGDQALYFNMAKSFADLHPIHEKYPIGFPLLLTPLVIMADAQVWQDLVKPVVFFHTMLAIISIYLVGYITRMVTRKISVSIMCALAWTLAPYVFYFFAGFFNAQWLRNTYVSDLMWFVMLSEPSTAFFLLVNIYLYFKSLEKESLTWLAGIVAGITFSIRITSAIYALVFAGGYVVQKRYRAAAIFVALITCTILPQLAYNLHFNHGLFTFGYTTIDATTKGREVLFSFAFTLSFINYLVSRHPFVFCTLLACALVAPATIFYAFRTARYQWGVLLGLVSIHILFYSTWWAFISDFIRYVMPIVPIVIIISGGFIAALQQWRGSPAHPKTGGGINRSL